MKRKGSKGITFLGLSLLCLFVLALALLFFAKAGQAQEDYPIPAGNPDRWMSSGRPEMSLPVQPPAPEQKELSAGLPQQGHGATSPELSWGDAQEEYTGTQPFGGIAGTGITRFGPESNY